MHDTETTADDAGIAEQLADLFRRGVGGHVEVLGALSEQGITDTAADQIGLISTALQAIEYLQRILAELATGHGMLIPRYHTQAGQWGRGRVSCIEKRLQAVTGAL